MIYGTRKIRRYFKTAKERIQRKLEREGQGIHQILVTMETKDAISNEAITIKNILKKMGYNSQIYAQIINPELKYKVRKYTDYKKHGPNDIIIYHHSIGIDFLDLIKNLDCKVIMIYHNITPPEFFLGINEKLACLCRLGIHQLEELKNLVNVVVTKSEFSKNDLVKLGYQNVQVMSMLLDKKKYEKEPIKNFISKYQNSINILHVGRLTKHKQVDEIIKIFHYYNDKINPNSNLFLVGRPVNFSDMYYLSLKSLVKKEKIKNVHFITNADDKKLITYYSLADVFITMSQHEGFCVPLVEAMMFKVPIIANNSSAIPYTLGEGGVLINNETYEEVAKIIEKITDDKTFRNQLIVKQSHQYQKLYLKDNISLLRELITQLKQN